MRYKNVAVVTLGCPKNEVMSRGIQEQLLKYGLNVGKDPKNCDLIIVNTCGFIDPAKEESINLLLELAKFKDSGKCRKIFAVGCLVQRYQQELSKSLHEIDGFISLEEIANIPELIGVDAVPDDIGKNRRQLAVGPWAYLQISEGCNRKCSFCIIPDIKGPYRSRASEDIIREAENLVANGARELIIVGQDTGAYGKDLNSNAGLTQLINDISQIKNLTWLRLMYLHPDYLRRELIEAFRDNPKLCNYLDIPLQHASKAVLASMRRSGSAEDYLKKLDLLAQAVPNVAIRSEIIVGYPGESGDDFKELIDFVEKLSPDYLGLFQYSSEAGTKAAKLPNKIPKNLKEKRFRKLRNLADDIGTSKKRALIGNTHNILVERVLDTLIYEGRLACQAPEIDGEVTLKSARPLKVGDMAEVVITAANGYDLEAEII